MSLPGCATALAVSAKKRRIAEESGEKIVELVKKNGIHELFSEPQYSAVAADTIAKETGAKIYVLDPAVTGPDDYDAYINIMENNLSVLKKAFGNNQKG